ncbi:MAG: ABC-F family ATP-binding cassette domain-containing protein, partial [Firmicutes bacterium]|nr:ABC-F family ATP-binding cassette domain-containing protein [Bacillota bacterium]
NKLCNKILEIEKGRVKLYNGNYDKYSVQKAQERDRLQFEYLQYINEKRRLEGALADIKQKAKSIKKAPKRMGNSEARLHKMGNQKAKASLDRARKNIKARIERMEVKEKPAQAEEIKFDLTEPEKLHSKIIIEASGINKSFANKIIFKDAEFKILNGSKVALIGSNGCGKSTLLKMIIQQDAAIKIAPAAKIGYFSQDMSILNEELTILENVMENSIYQESFVRTLLARLLFKGEDVYKKVKVLSGGERVKISFAKILLDDFNLLLLDEPTNYLDIKSLEVIEEALRNYNRTLIFVSHDRSLINSVADHIMVIKNQKIEMFNGSYAEYLARKDLAPSKGKEDAEKQILILQNRLSEIVGRLSMPSKQDNLEELDHEYHEIMGELKKLKASLENKN